MPQTRGQELFFTAVMVLFMAFGMTLYNDVLSTGIMTMEVFWIALCSFPIVYVIAFVLEFFFIGKLVQKLTFKIIDPSKTQPIFITLVMQGITVMFMCPSMSLVAVLLFTDVNINTFLISWLNAIVLNFAVALFYQVFYASPIVRKIFSLVFKLKNENNK